MRDLLQHSAIRNIAFVVGLGISPTLHISRETEEVFRSCEEILYLDTNVAITY